MMRRWQKWAMGLMMSLGLVMPVASAGADDGHAQVDLSTEQIEAIVRDYLLREPEIVFQALEELQRRQASAETERQQTAITAHEDQLLRDPEAPVAGNPDGAVTLVEFFDYRCSYCRRVVGSVQALIEEDTDLRMVFKELPVLGEDSIRAARAALASRKQEGYLPLHFALMDSDDLSMAGIKRTAEAVGLDAEQLQADMETPEVDAAIQANYELARTLGIEGTPAFVIGDQLIPGAVDRARLEELIAEARASG